MICGTTPQTPHPPLWRGWGWGGGCKAGSVTPLACCLCLWLRSRQSVGVRSYGLTREANTQCEFFDCSLVKNPADAYTVFRWAQQLILGGWAA